ncbi:MAG: hypothetical protein AB1810_14295 [Pseudomonadota bacterium]
MNYQLIAMCALIAALAALSACNSDNAAENTPVQGEEFSAAVQRMTATTLEESEPEDVETIVANEIDDVEAEPVE